MRLHRERSPPVSLCSPAAGTSREPLEDGIGATDVFTTWRDISIEFLPPTLEILVVQVFLDQVGHPGRYWLFAGGFLDAARYPFGHANRDAANRHNINIT